VRTARAGELVGIAQPPARQMRASLKEERMLGRQAKIVSPATLQRMLAYAQRTRQPKRAAAREPSNIVGQAGQTKTLQRARQCSFFMAGKARWFAAAIRPGKSLTGMSSKARLLDKSGHIGTVFRESCKDIPQTGFNLATINPAFR
jgi:hypothetical protein